MNDTYNQQTFYDGNILDKNNKKMYIVIKDINL